MTLERLGTAPDTGAAVWVVWFDGAPGGAFVAALATAAPLRCPECGAGVDLLRPRGVVWCAAETPGCGSISDRCPNCQAQLHFDTTPAAERAALRWPKVAVGQLPVTFPAIPEGPAREALEALGMRGR